jgi:hypothetical protein
VLYVVWSLLGALAQWVRGSRGAVVAATGREELPIADEVQGWLWLRDEVGRGGSGGRAAARNDPSGKR